MAKHIDKPAKPRIKRDKRKGSLKERREKKKQQKIKINLTFRAF